MAIPIKLTPSDQLYQVTARLNHRPTKGILEVGRIWKIAAKSPKAAEAIATEHLAAKPESITTIEVPTQLVTCKCGMNRIAVSSTPTRCPDCGQLFRSIAARYMQRRAS